MRAFFVNVLTPLVRAASVGTVLLVSFLSTPIATAAVIGSFGDVYPIIEPDFLAFIQSRLTHLEATGELAAWREEMSEVVKQKADRPTPVSGLGRAHENRYWHIDPSLTLTRDLKDAKGHVFATQGTVFNPLGQVSLSRALLFIDGDDKEQVEWAQREEAFHQGQTQLILVNGSIHQMTAHFHKAISFDQAGRLTERFHIKALPAIVTQDGLQLKGEEVAL